ncbi:MAG: SWI/SNF chromatin-remodeling complex subunit [Phylliscum demangeonii]|nr:MAG: SWI/SNF chromatin-remodeling complex subunit [Phylliscum demangeonii]
MPSPAKPLSPAPAPAPAPATVEILTSTNGVADAPAFATDVLAFDGLRRPDHGPDAIAEGKLKARAVLAASTPPPPERARARRLAAAHREADEPSERDEDVDDDDRARMGPVLKPPPSPNSARPRSVPSSPPPSRPSVQELRLDQYSTRDQLYTAAHITQSLDQRELIRCKRREIEYYQIARRDRAMNPGAIFGPGYAGFGNGHTDGKPQILYPAQRKRPGSRRTKPLTVSRREMARQAEQVEDLVPIRLDIEWGKIKLRDTYTWNLHERVITPELFAENLIEDFQLPPEQSAPLAQMVAQAVKDQTQDYHPHVFLHDEPLDPHLPYHAYKNDEMRILIRLNITIGPHTLLDQFEWDLHEPANSPEDYARQMTSDLALAGEFTTAIAHAIREQCQLFTKGLYVTAHPFDGRPVEDADLRDAFLPSPLPAVLRPAQQAKEYAPSLWELNEADLERTESSLSREQRRQKRSVNRRGGPTLPDLKDRPRTIRTLAISSVIPGAAASIDESRIYKRSEGSRAGRRSGPGARGAAGDDSDLSDSDESAVDSPPAAAAAAAKDAILYAPGRTRGGGRGAAAVAQMAMRATLGRSATPEGSPLHHHETRTSARRFGGGTTTAGRETREESFGDGGSGSLVVKLKLPPELLRRFVDPDPRTAVRSRREATPLPKPPAMADAAAPSSSVAAAGASSSLLPPAMAPAANAPAGVDMTAHVGAGGDGNATAARQQIGAVDATGPLREGQPAPPPPPWLTSGLARLQANYPDDAFVGIMRHALINAATGELKANDDKDKPLPPAAYKPQWLPRIRCKDCPGRLYTPGPGMTVENFETHLKNQHHRRKVAQRVGAGAGAGAG